MRWTDTSDTTHPTAHRTAVAMQSVLLNTNKQGIREQDRAPSGSRKLAANKHKRNMFANRVHEQKRTTTTKLFGLF